MAPPDMNATEGHHDDGDEGRNSASSGGRAYSPSSSSVSWSTSNVDVFKKGRHDTSSTDKHSATYLARTKHNIKSWWNHLVQNISTAVLAFMAFLILLRDDDGGGLSRILPWQHGCSDGSKDDGEPYNAKIVHVTTWNVGGATAERHARNLHHQNNPFEYWMTHPEYEKLLTDVEELIEQPTEEQDVPISQIFTDEMFDELDDLMTSVAGWPSIRRQWKNEYRHRRFISDFVKDSEITAKRLVTTPDCATNTIMGATRKRHYRPTIISRYKDTSALSSIPSWWAVWKSFMFHDEIATEKEGEGTIPYRLVEPIQSSSIPEITTDEEAVSLPLQTLCCAIYDCILIHILNNLISQPERWQSLRRQLIKSFNRRISKSLSILRSEYYSTDVGTLQCVTRSYIEAAKLPSTGLGDKYHVLVPSDMDHDEEDEECDAIDCDNNFSAILLKKETFVQTSIKEVTDRIVRVLPTWVTQPPRDNQSLFFRKGDLLVIRAMDRKHNKGYVIASFRSKEGRTTKAILHTLINATAYDYELKSDHLIFGLDAHTQAQASIWQSEQHHHQQRFLSAKEFAEQFVTLGVGSCWGPTVLPQHNTTCTARTYLQPQLDLAVKREDRNCYGDNNPTDHILFYRNDFDATSTTKDNTGEKVFVEGVSFPTIGFPSHHAIVSTVLISKD